MMKQDETGNKGTNEVLNDQELHELPTHLVETNSGFGSEKRNMSKQPTGLGGRQLHLQSLRCLDAIWPPACERQVVLLPGPEALNWEAEGGSPIVG